jgi:hypothetical protein
MARKASQPALYELMRSSRRERSRPAPQQAAPPSPEPDPDPAGGPDPVTRRSKTTILWIGAASLAGAAILAFSFGFLVRDRSRTADQDRQWLALHGSTLPVPDPEAPDEPPRNVQPPTPSAAAGIETVLPPGYGPIASDPREPGLNYFILAYTPRDNAVKLARFFRDQGVEAYAVKAKNASLYRVIAAPGYPRGDRGGEAVRALERRIAEAARKWKLEVNSRDDLAYYPERFDGPASPRN